MEHLCSSMKGLSAKLVERTQQTWEIEFPEKRSYLMTCANILVCCWAQLCIKDRGDVPKHVLIKHGLKNHWEVAFAKTMKKWGSAEEIIREILAQAAFVNRTVQKWLTLQERSNTIMPDLDNLPCVCVF